MRIEAGRSEPTIHHYQDKLKKATEQKMLAEVELNKLKAQLESLKATTKLKAEEKAEEEQKQKEQQEKEGATNPPKPDTAATNRKGSLGSGYESQGSEERRETRRQLPMNKEDKSKDSPWPGPSNSFSKRNCCIYNVTSFKRCRFLKFGF